MENSQHSRCCLLPPGVPSGALGQSQMHVVKHRTPLLPGVAEAARFCSKGSPWPGGAVLSVSFCAIPACSPALMWVTGTRARSGRGESTDLQLRKQKLSFQHHLCLPRILYKVPGSMPQFPLSVKRGSSHPSAELSDRQGGEALQEPSHGSALRRGRDREGGGKMCQLCSRSSRKDLRTWVFHNIHFKKPGNLGEGKEIKKVR